MSRHGRIMLLAVVATIAFMATASASPEVSCVQTKLVSLGFDPGPVDGQLGAATISAADAANQQLSTRLVPLAKDSSATVVGIWCYRLTISLFEKTQRSEAVSLYSDLAESDPILRKFNKGMELAREVVGTDVPVTMYAFRAKEALLAAYSAATGNSRKAAERHFGFAWAITANGGIFVNINRFKPDRVAFKLGAHEYLHVVHDHYLGRTFGGDESKTPRDGPYWLTEGLAEHGAQLTLAQDGDRRWQQTERRVAVRSAAKLDSVTILGPWQKMHKTENSFGISHLAVEYLVSLTSLGQVAKDYWQSRRERGGEEWEETFARVFGMTVPEFAEKFRTYVKSGAR